MASSRRFIPSIVAFLAQVVLQVSGYQSPILASILAVLMVVLAVIGGWPWLKRIQNYLWVAGIPAAFGLLLGLVGWLIFSLLYGVLIGSVAWALTQVIFTVWAIRRLGAKVTPSAESGNEGVPMGGGTLTYEGPEAFAGRLKTENEELKARLRETEQERDELTRGNEELLAQRDEAPERLDAEELHKRFYSQPLQEVGGATFVGERIPLDGFHYDHCSFERCTLVYWGEKPFGLSHFELRGNDTTVEAHTP